MMYLTVIAIFAALVSVSDLTHDLQWCMRPSNDDVDVFQQVKALLGVGTSNLSADDVNNITTQLLFRAKCDITVGSDCSQCLTPSNIFKILKMEEVRGMNDKEFLKYSTILLNYIHHLPERCNRSTEIASKWNYTNFTDSFMYYHTHGKPMGYFTSHQLEFMLRDINATYRPGQYSVSNGTWKTEPDIQYVCWSHDSMWFQNRDIWSSCHFDHPEMGASADELGEMNSYIILRLLKGECIRKDRSAISGLPVKDDFEKAIFRKYGNHSNCKIEKSGLEKLLKNVGVANGTEHDHDQKHEHSGEEHSEHASHENEHSHKEEHSDEHHHSDEHGHNGEDDEHQSDEHNNHDEDPAEHDDSDHSEEVDLDLSGSVHADHTPKRHRREVDVHGDENEDEHQDKVNVSATCYNKSEILNILNLDEKQGVDRDGFRALCPLLLQQLTERTCWKKVPEKSQQRKLTKAQKYGYGTLAVAIISLLALPGIVIVRWRNTPAYKYIISCMLGVAVGTLVGDATLHLIPQALGMHNHEEESHEGHDHGESNTIIVEPFVWKMFVLNISLYAFFTLQAILTLWGSRKLRKLSKSPSKTTDIGVEGVYKVSNGHAVQGTDNVGFDEGLGQKKGTHGSHHEMMVCDIPSETQAHGHSHVPGNGSFTSNDSQTDNSALGWMVTIGDAVHNLADGLAIGAAFAIDWRSGLSTSIAVACHELPHEFGDIAAMLSIGWSTRRVLCFNLLAAMTAFVGLYIGIPAAQNEEARGWILIVAGGMFLYVALCDILPEIFEMARNHQPVYIFFVSATGILIGLGIMMIIAIFESKIRV